MACTRWVFYHCATHVSEYVLLIEEIIVIVLIFLLHFNFVNMYLECRECLARVSSFIFPGVSSGDQACQQAP